METRKIIKLAAEGVAGAATAKVVKDFFDHNLPVTEGTYEKVMRYLGVTAISGIVCYLAEKWACDKVDDVFEIVDVVKETAHQIREDCAEISENDLNSKKEMLNDISKNLAERMAAMTEVYVEGDEQNEAKEEVEDGGKDASGELEA